MDIHITPPTHVAETPFARQPPALVLFGRSAGGKPRAARFEAADTEAATAAAKAMQLRVLSVTTDEQRDVAGKLTRGRVAPSGRAHVPFAKHDLYVRLVALAGAEADLRVIADRSGERDTEMDASGDAKPAEVAAEPLLVAAGQCSTQQAETSGQNDEARPNERNAAAKPDLASATPEQPKPRPGDRTFVGQPKPDDHADIGLGSVVLAHEGPDEGWWEAEVIGINGRVFSLRWRDYPTQPTILRKATELALLPPGEA